MADRSPGIDACHTAELIGVRRGRIEGRAGFSGFCKPDAPGTALGIALGVWRLGRVR